MKIKKFIAAEAVLCIAFLLAVISTFFNPPSMDYFSFIDFRVLGILLGLMLVMDGLRRIGIFEEICRLLTGFTRNTMQLSFVLVLLCFFSSMFITNDVALVTFVPLAIMTLRQTGNEDKTVITVIMQTVAANLGSMLMPSGNPQNLYLFDLSGMDLAGFVLLMLPYTAISLILISVFIILGKNRRIESNGAAAVSFTGKQKVSAVIYALIFTAGILAVCRVLPWYFFLLLSCISAFILNKKSFLTVDYSLLATFICFFVFIGNISSLDSVRHMLTSTVSGREALIGIVASQFISNVPAALMLSGFTENYSELIIGVDLGGLGTLIASMASLISYKAAAAACPEKRRTYILQFSAVNAAFLIILYAFHLIIHSSGGFALCGVRPGGFTPWSPTSL